MKLKHTIAAVFVLFSVKGMAQKDSVFIYQKPLFDFDYNKPVFKLQDAQSINKNSMLRFVSVSGYREGVSAVAGAFGLNFKSYTDTVSGILQISFYNSSIADIVGHGLVPRHEIYLEVKDPSKYLYDPKYGDKESWMRKNAYCYELALPQGTIKDVSTLDKFLSHDFGVTFGAAKRMVKALILVRTSGVDKLKSAEKGEGKYDMQGHFNNIPIDRLSHPLKEAGLPPMVDETGYTGNVDLDLKISSWTDLEALRRELARYDLDLKDGMRELEVFVITEKDFKSKN